MKVPPWAGEFLLVYPNCACHVPVTEVTALGLEAYGTRKEDAAKPERY